MTAAHPRLMTYRRLCVHAQQRPYFALGALDEAIDPVGVGAVLAESDLLPQDLFTLCIQRDLADTQRIVLRDRIDTAGELAVFGDGGLLLHFLQSLRIDHHQFTPRLRRLRAQLQSLGPAAPRTEVVRRQA